MDYLAHDIDGTPVLVKGARPGRGRARYKSDYPACQNVYVDENGYLAPAVAATTNSLTAPRAHRRAASLAASRPASVIINNNRPWDEGLGGSAVVMPRRRSSHGLDYLTVVSDEDDEIILPERHAGKLVAVQPRGRSRAHSYAHSRSPSPYYDPAFERKLVKLERYEREEELRQAKERFEQEKIIEAEKKRRKEAEQKELKQKWIVEHQLEQEKKKKQEEQKAKEAEEAHRSWALKQFSRAGYSEDHVERILKVADHKKESRERALVRTSPIMDASRPMHIRVKKKDLDTVTLDAFHLPWAKDPVSTSCSASGRY